MLSRQQPQWYRICASRPARASLERTRNARHFRRGNTTKGSTVKQQHVVIKSHLYLNTHSLLRDTLPLHTLQLQLCTLWRRHFHSISPGRHLRHAVPMLSIRGEGKSMMHIPFLCVAVKSWSRHVPEMSQMPRGLAKVLAKVFNMCHQVGIMLCSQFQKFGQKL